MSDNGQHKIELPPSLTIRELADEIKASPIDVIKQLMANGVMANINQQIDYETAAIVAGEFGFETTLVLPTEAEAQEEVVEAPRWRQLIGDEDEAALEDRPPVVTVLGHVDHGKTTLLDAIRKANVAEGEAGGITQHISAYQITHNDRLITFLDTPGHAAFTAMRARGAQGADIAVLVVAADDGVMPQTREALSHARAAGVPIVVALNKIDRPNANEDKVKQELADVGLIPDEWDGETMVVPVSAKEELGLEDLLEAIVLVADTADIRANPEGTVIGTVIEAEIDRTKGVVATLLVQNGTLHVADTVLAGTSHGRIRAMFDFRGQPIEMATPSMPVSVLGLSDVPAAGELFSVVADEREARALADEREQARGQKRTERKGTALEQIFEAFMAGETKELRLVVKADVQGSLEPIISSVEDLSTEDITVTVLHSGTGNIGENDVMLAAASDAIVIGFNVVADNAAQRVADSEGITIRLYNIIYRLIEDIEKALKGMLDPETRKVSLGQAEVRAVFRIPRMGNVAGCMVVKGDLRRNANMRVHRDKKVIHDGPISSLKHEKDDVRTVREGFECGVGLKGFDDFQVGDILECYVEETVPIV